MRTRRSRFWGIWLLLIANAHAADIERLDIRQDGADYSITLVAVLDAPLLQVWPVLTDYAKFHELSPSVTKSEVVAQLSHTAHRVRTRARVCVLIFCKDLDQVQTLEQAKTGELLIVVDPKASDFEFGRARWLLVEHERGTRVHFQSRLRPAFWVPPLVGPWAIKRSMRYEAQATCSRLESLARMGSP